MGRDPAFLFYDADASRDIRGLSREERGAYLDFILEQKQFGRLSLDAIKRLFGQDFDKYWSCLERILTYDKDMCYICWLDEAIDKRKAYSASRQRNRTSKTTDTKKKVSKGKNISSTYDKHMVNENENVIINKEESGVGAGHPLQDFVRTLPTVSKLRTQLTFEDCESLIKLYPKELIREKLNDMENHAPLLKKYKSVYLTLNTWCKLAQSKSIPVNEKQPVAAPQFRRIGLGQDTTTGS